MGWDTQTVVVVVCLALAFAWLQGRARGRDEVRVVPREHEHLWSAVATTVFVRGVDGPGGLPRTAVTYVCRCGMHRQDVLLGEHNVDELRWRAPASEVVDELLDSVRREPPKEGA